MRRKLIYIPKREEGGEIRATYQAKTPLLMAPTFPASGKTTSDMTGFKGYYSFTRPSTEYADRGAIFYKRNPVYKDLTPAQIGEFIDRYVPIYNWYYTFTRGLGTPEEYEFKMDGTHSNMSLKEMYVCVLSGTLVKPYKLKIETQELKDFVFLKLKKLVNDDIIYSVTFGDTDKVKLFFEKIYNMDVSQQKEYVWNQQTGSYREATDTDEQRDKVKGKSPSETNEYIVLMSSRFTPQQVFASYNGDYPSYYMPNSPRTYLPVTEIAI